MSLRNWGSQKKYVHDDIGFNHRLDTIQAGFLNIKIKRLNHWNKIRIKLARIYCNELKNIKKIKLPNCNNDMSHVYHLFVIRVQERSKFQKFLLENGIQTIIHYPTPCHKHKAFKKFPFYKKTHLNAEIMSKEIISLPLYPGLSEDKIIYICKVIKLYFKEH